MAEVGELDNYYKILVVDDEFIMRQGIKHMVNWEQEGFRVIGEAANGREAMKSIEEEEPNIVISDVVMPQMDGIELTRVIQDNYPHIRMVILSSYSDFEYVKSSFQHGAVDYILKPALNPEELLKVIKKIAAGCSFTPSQAKIPVNSELSHLLLGFDAVIDHADLAKKFPYSNFCMFGIDTTRSYPNYQKQSTLIERVSSEIHKAAFEETAIQMTVLEKEIFILLLNYEDWKTTEVFRKLKDIAAAVNKEFSHAFFVVTKQFGEITQVRQVYEEDFIKSTGRQFYNKGVFINKDLPVKINEPYEKFDFKKFSDLVSMLRLEEALCFLKEYIEYSVKKQCLSEFDLKSLIQNSLYNIITALETLKYNETALNSLKYNSFKQIDQSRYATDLLSALNTVLMDFKAIIDVCSNTIDSHINKKIMQYIYEHYDEPLALTDVAKRFNFNYSYFSTYFSTHNKEGFNEFLNKIRIEKAVEMLNKDIPISQISSLVGYAEHSYFCKVFKKITGVTPSHYRKNTIL